MVAAHSCAGRSRRNCGIGRGEVAGAFAKRAQASPSIRVGGAAEFEFKERKDRGDGAVPATRAVRARELHLKPLFVLASRGACG